MCIQGFTHNYKLPPEVVMLKNCKDIFKLLIVIMNPGDQTKRLNLDFIA